MFGRKIDLLEVGLHAEYEVARLADFVAEPVSPAFQPMGAVGHAQGSGFLRTDRVCTLTPCRSETIGRGRPFTSITRPS